MLGDIQETFITSTSLSFFTQKALTYDDYFTDKVLILCIGSEC